MVNKKIKPFKIPDSLLKQINECSAGGFILFTISENGSPEVHSDFDTELNEIGLWGFVRNISNAIDDATGDAMRGSLGEPPEE